MWTSSDPMDRTQDRQPRPCKAIPLALVLWSIVFLGIGFDPAPASSQDASESTAVLQTSGSKKHRLEQDRPIQLGTSGGNVKDVTPLECCDGTLGALVEKNGAHYILSNNHVLARSNKGKQGEAIIQPGLGDQRPICQPLTPDADTVATLTARKRVKFNSSKTNKVDAAIAEVFAGRVDPSGEILGIGIPGTDPVPAVIGMRVKKSGRTTGLTKGTVIAVNASAIVEFPKKCGSEVVNQARFTDLIFIAGNNDKPFIRGGDSGSMVYENKKSCPSPVGLIFAGSEEVAAASPAVTVKRIVGNLKPKGEMRFVGCQSSSLQSASDITASSSSAESSTWLDSSNDTRRILDERQIELATRAMRRREGEILRGKGIHSLGIGVSLDGAVEPAIYVFSDRPRQEVVRRLPERIDGYRVEVFESPRLVAK
jgi:hypothetical protein